MFLKVSVNETLSMIDIRLWATLNPCPWCIQRTSKYCPWCIQRTYKYCPWWESHDPTKLCLWLVLANVPFQILYLMDITQCSCWVLDNSLQSLSLGCQTMAQNPSSDDDRTTDLKPCLSSESEHAVRFEWCLLIR